MANQLDISYNTVRKALIISRLAILAHYSDSPRIFSSLGLLSLLGNQEKTHLKNPVLGVREEAEQAFVDYLPHFSLESILHFRMGFQLQTKSIGHVIYTDSYKQYTGLVLYDTGIFDRYRLRPSKSPLALDRESHFWTFALPRLEQFKDQNPLKLLLYLKELQFRYNQRQSDIFSELALRICAFVPSLE
ncbi:MAG: hypothetical protein ACQEQX_06695 [Thermodesulfobacteriota bacterium]